MNYLVLGDSLEALLDHRGKTPKKLGGDFEPSGVPVASALLVRDGRLDLSEARHVSAEMHAKWMPQRTERGDVILTSEAPAGRVARVASDDPLVLGQRLFCLRGKKGVLDSGFLYYALQSHPVQSSILGHSTGTTVVGIRQSALRLVRIPAPSFPEQQAIAEVLGALDDKIAANTALAGTAEQLLRAEIDAAWLHNGNRDAMLSDYVIMNPKTTMPRVDNAIYIDMKRLPEAGWSIDGYDYREPKGGARFQNGDTLLARITPCLENRKTGFVDHLPNGEIGIGSTEFIVMRSRGDVAAPISFLLATEARFRDFAVQHMVGTSGRQRVGAADIATFTLPRPNPMWLAGFGRRAEAVFSAVAAHVAENRTLAATRDALLPQLMSGKLRARAAETLASAVI